MISQHDGKLSSPGGDTRLTTLVCRCELHGSSDRAESFCEASLDRRPCVVERLAGVGGRCARRGGAAALQQVPAPHVTAEKDKPSKACEPRHHTVRHGVAASAHHIWVRSVASRSCPSGAASHGVHLPIQATSPQRDAWPGVAPALWSQSVNSDPPGCAGAHAVSVRAPHRAHGAIFAVGVAGSVVVATAHGRDPPQATLVLRI